jgi:hypothetical protein
MKKGSAQQSPLAVPQPRWREELRAARELKEREGRQSVAGTRSRLGTPYAWRWPQGW